MNERNIIPIAYFSTLLFTFIGFYMIKNEIENGIYSIFAGLTTGIVFIVLAIKEVSNSKNNDSSTKTIWYIALISVPTIAGLFYILSARKNITNQNKLTQN